ncbi:hypothetical protein TIFTF001_024134 [Ficus carica]|uniref:Uncharacterized protein n=1 Tax=Ficus carica TaxID=3494 RepID=A0AA88DFU6_FICCA|nr:hypothetical protein TIFTF001_024134 [Ficus carica]
MRGLEKTIVMRYTVEPRMPLVRIQCDADVNFYIQPKKKDVHMLSKFPISIDVLDKSVAKAIPPEVGECNHIYVQLSRVGGQSDEAVQPIAVNNLIIPSSIPPPIPPPIPSPIVGLDLEFNVEEAARDSNERSIVGSIRAQSVVNRTRTQFVHVSGNDNFSGTVVKMSTTTLLHMVCINNEKCPSYLHATRMTSSELSIVKRYDGVHTCSIEIVQGHHCQAKSWMIGEAWRGKEAALTSLRGDDAESYKASIVYPDADFGICVQHLTVNLKMRYKHFKGPIKTYYGSASRAYLVSEHQGHMESIRNRNPDMHRYLASRFSKVCNRDNQHCEVIEQCGSESQVNASGILGRMVKGITTKPRPADQFEYAVTNCSNLDCGCERNDLWIKFLVLIYGHLAECWDVYEEVRFQVVNPSKTKHDPGRLRVTKILSQGPIPRSQRSSTSQSTVMRRCYD